MPKELEGIKVVDLSQGVSGPFCSLMLADMGAEVIKVEPPTGDIARCWGPPFVSPDKSAYFYSLNRNKKSVALNLKAPLGREAFTSLIQTSDVLIENFRPGVLEKLNFSWSDLRKINANLIYCSVTGFGQDGPSANETAFDIIIQARSGLMSVTGEKDGLPMKIGIPMVDIGSGMYAAFATMCAIYRRDEGYGGSRIDISMLDCAFSWLCYWVSSFSATGRELSVEGNVHPTISPYQLFRAKDGAIAIAITSDRLWQRFLEAVNRKDLLSDVRFENNAKRVQRRGELTSILNSLISNYNTHEFVNLMTKQGIPCAPVQTVKQVMTDPQLVYRKMILEVGEILVPGSPVKIDSSSSELCSNPPKLGEDTVKILENKLGWSRERIAKLEQECKEYSQ